MRQQGLDLIRFVAIMLVLGSHFLGLAQTVPGILGQVLQIWEQGGWVGVDLFFVLSGFLVSKLLLEEYLRTGKVMVGRFLIRRGFKIYPSFYFFTAVATLLFWASGQFSWPRLLSELFFLQNYCIGFWVLFPGVEIQPGQLVVGIIDQAQWSLAVEEHFYFAIALIFLGLAAKKKFRLFPALCLGIALACQFARILYAFQHEVGKFGAASTCTHFRLDSLFFGAALAYGYCFYQGPFTGLANRFKPLLITLGGIGLLPFFLLHRTTSPLLLITYGFTLLYVSSGCLIVGVLYSEDFLSQAKICRPLAFLGRYSYGIYLWHLLIRYGVWRWGFALWGASPPPLLPICAYLGLSIVSGVTTSLLIEVPFLRVRERWFPRIL